LESTSSIAELVEPATNSKLAKLANPVTNANEPATNNNFASVAEPATNKLHAELAEPSITGSTKSATNKHLAKMAESPNVTQFKFRSTNRDDAAIGRNWCESRCWQVPQAEGSLGGERCSGSEKGEVLGE
jgi:hypothetical protein